MQFTLGVLSTLCLVLITALAVVMIKLNKKLNKGFEETCWGLGKVMGEVAAVNQTIANLPPTIQNIIHLGIKPGAVETGVEPIKVPVSPTDFIVQADKLREKLLHGLETKNHPDTDTRAYCILDHAGMSAIVESESLLSVRKALTRLLLNGDEDATKRFLETLADSVAAATAS